MNDNQATPETDAHMLGGSYSFDVEFARRLERERDEARKLLRDANRGAERNAHISQSLASQLVESRRELDEARAQLYRICCEGFDNQDTIGLEPADDYVLRKLADLRQALSGRTVSCSQCNESARKLADAEAELSISNSERDHYRRENGEMREALIACMEIIGPPDGSPELLWKTDDEINAAYTKAQKALNHSAPATSQEKT
jgi:hypothetical protein